MAINLHIPKRKLVIFSIDDFMSLPKAQWNGQKLLKANWKTTNSKQWTHYFEVTDLSTQILQTAVTYLYYLVALVVLGPVDYSNDNQSSCLWTYSAYCMLLPTFNVDWLNFKTSGLFWLLLRERRGNKIWETVRPIQDVCLSGWRQGHTKHLKGYVLPVPPSAHNVLGIPVLVPGVPGFPYLEGGVQRRRYATCYILLRTGSCYTTRGMQIKRPYIISIPICYCGTCVKNSLNRWFVVLIS